MCCEAALSSERIFCELSLRTLFFIRCWVAALAGFFMCYALFLTHICFLARVEKGLIIGRVGLAGDCFGDGPCATSGGLYRVDPVSSRIMTG